MFEKEKQQMLDYALKMDRYGLIALSGGNLSWRMPTGEVIVTPSGMIYDEMVADDMLVVDLEGNIIEGTRKASVDTEALLYIYKNMPKVNAVIHTHQPYATGLGLVMDEIPCNLSTLANATEGPVNVAAYGDPGNLAMGVEAVKAIGDRLAVVLKHHGASLPLAVTFVRPSSLASTSRRPARPFRSRSPRPAHGNHDAGADRRGRCGLPPLWSGHAQRARCRRGSQEQLAS